MISTEELGDRSYVVHAGRDAVAIDPQRDTDRIQDLLDRQGLVLSLVVETHIHNDYVIGGLALAQRHGARDAVNAADPVSFDRFAVSEGDSLQAASHRRCSPAVPCSMAVSGGPTWSIPRGPTS